MFHCCVGVRFDADFPDWSRDSFDSQTFIHKWFQGGPELDDQIKRDFGADVEAVRKGQYDNWLESSMAEGLAGVILMDQMTRNIYCGTAQMCARQAVKV